jgi:hypothetical protein
MSSKEEKRPPWYRYGARKEWDGSMKTYKEIQARLVPKSMRDEYDIDVPPTWQEQPSIKLLRGLGTGDKSLPPGSGYGLVQSPYADIYTKIYGVNPLADLPQYRKIYRSQPDVQDAVQMQVNLAVGKGFTIYHKDKKVTKFIVKLCDRINLPQHLPVMATDALVYGNSFTELQWDEVEENKEQIYEYQGENYTKDDLESLDIPLKKVQKAVYKGENEVNNKNFIAKSVKKSGKAKTIIALKDLDPLYMRVRRDSFGNQYGFIQWMAFPPVLIDNESCIHIRNRPASWGYESAYGTSLLMPILKNNDLLLQFENDAATWVHSRAVPPLIVKGGSMEKPYTTAQMGDLMSTLKSRTAATMIFTKGDVEFEEMQTIASDLNLDWWLNYLLLRRYQSLGVPPILMGKADKGSKGGAEVILHDFIAKLQVLQEFIADSIEEFIFRPLITEEFGEDVENASIIWKPIIEEDKNMRSQRLIQLLQAGAISVNECRSEMGFNRIPEAKYDKLEKAEPVGFSKGVPQTEEEQPVEKEKTQPDVKRITEQSKTPPESNMKMEEIKAKKIELLQLDEQFRESLIGLTQKAKFELQNDAMLVKDVKTDLFRASKESIDKYALSSYLLKNKPDTLEFNETDIEPYQLFKTACFNEVRKNFDGMVSKKENLN